MNFLFSLQKLLIFFNLFVIMVVQVNLDGGVLNMAKCDVCGKGVSFGIKVSHSHRRSNKMWKSNVRRVKAVVDGSVKHVNVCTKCLRSGKVQRAAD